jgi:hypothetical protein
MSCSCDAGFLLCSVLAAAPAIMTILPSRLSSCCPTSTAEAIWYSASTPTMRKDDKNLQHKTQDQLPMTCLHMCGAQNFQEQAPQA